MVLVFYAQHSEINSITVKFAAWQNMCLTAQAGVGWMSNCLSTIINYLIVCFSLFFIIIFIFIIFSFKCVLKCSALSHWNLQNLSSQISAGGGGTPKRGVQNQTVMRVVYICFGAPDVCLSCWCQKGCMCTTQLPNDRPSTASQQAVLFALKI